VKNSEKKLSKFFKRLKGVSLRSLHNELNRIWFNFEDIDTRLKKLEEKAGIIKEEVKVEAPIVEETTTDEPVVATVNTTEGMTEETTENVQTDVIDVGLIALDAAKAEAEAIGIKVHHKAKLPKILELIEEKKKAE